MIKNERQYRITRTQAERFARTLEGLRSRPEGADGMHPMIAQAQVDAVSSQLADLEAELREYEAIREGGFEVEALRVVTDLPELLIKARISQGITQRELADRLGLKEQQIQRYEATDYATAKWSRIREVAGALSMELGGSAQAVEAHH
jgi:ribosome-binding protein aMBF1 (putative translation factor)